MILQSFICLVILYKIISHQFFTSILPVCHCFMYNGESRSLPSFILYDVLNLKTLGVRALEPPACTSGDCDQTWRERGTSWYVAFGTFKRFWQTRALGQCFATLIAHGTPNNFLKIFGIPRPLMQAIHFIIYFELLSFTLMSTIAAS